MVLPKSRNSVGLGNSLMNDRFGKGHHSNMHRQSQDGGITRRDPQGNTYVTPTRKDGDDWVKMRSVTEQGALDEFLSTAELAGTDFTAAKMDRVRVIHPDQQNPYLLSTLDEKRMVKKHEAKRERLTVPRRPAWDESTTPQVLDARERQAFLEWRRGLADLQETDDLLLTPFERNLEVWRQLWRVIERSDLVVQIVDARNPLLYRCEDLEKYVKEVDSRKKNLLLVNKADMMTDEQRRVWAEWFQNRGIAFRFFSAELARHANTGQAEDVADTDDEDEGRAKVAESENEDDEKDDNVDVEEDVEHSGDSTLDEDDVNEQIDLENELSQRTRNISLQQSNGDGGDAYSSGGRRPPDTSPVTTSITLQEQSRILTTDDLEALFLAHSTNPALSKTDSQVHKTTIGLVGYPNVGKSSTINALLGSKKVSVSATPGKTKHFQTIHLSPRVVLCDCPGLVFPNFATTKAELVCAGVLPIDQLREYTAPAALVAQRIPKAVLEGIYGMRIIIRPIEEGGTGVPTGDEVLRAYARARGFSTQGLGQPDQARAARMVLKDYVKGRLLFCHPPPLDPPVDARTFNRGLYEQVPLRRKQHARVSGPGPGGSPEMSTDRDAEALPMPPRQGAKGQQVDQAFFAPGQGRGSVVRPFHYKYTTQGKEFSGRKLKTVMDLEKDVDPEDMKLSSKKHFKAHRRKAAKIPTAGNMDD